MRARATLRGTATPAALVAAALLLAGCGQVAVGTTSGTSSSTSPASTTSSSAPSASSASSASGGATGTGLSESVVITAPADGERLPAGPMGIVGTGTAAEGTLLWSITQADGTELSSGFTTAGANGEIGDFAVQQTVQAGSCTPCTAKVWAPDESQEGGAGEGEPGGPDTAATITFFVD